MSGFDPALLAVIPSVAWPVAWVYGIVALCITAVLCCALLAVRDISVAAIKCRRCVK